MDNYTNSYEQFNTEYQQAMTPQPKKKNKVPGIILVVLSVLFLIAGFIVVFAAENFSKMETQEPNDIYWATESDEYSYAKVQYMTEAAVYFEAMENLQLYIVMDSEWNPAVVCMHNDEVAAYQPYIDWLYSDSYENGPEETTIVGYAQPFSAEVSQMIMEYFNESFEEELVDESNFAEWFGEYYLQVGQKSNAYTISKLGIYILLVGVILMVVGGVLLYDKDKKNEESSGPIVQNSNMVAGLIAAIVGAALGGLLWTIVGALGFIVGWLGVGIVLFAYIGYSIFEHRHMVLGAIVSVILGFVMVALATYLTYAWGYYCNINESLGGYTPLGRAIKELAVYLTTNKEWGTLAVDLIKGYAFMVLASFYVIAQSVSKKNK